MHVPAGLWSRSLPLRVVVSTLAGSVVVLLLGGLLLVQQATAGVVNAKKQSALAEATIALNTLQEGLQPASVTQESLTDRLTDLVIDAASRGSVGGQYQVIVQGPVSDLRSNGVLASSVPDGLRDALGSGNGVWVTPTLLHYSDGRSAEPAIAVGANLVAPGAGRYPIFFLFPMDREVETLEVLQRAVLTTGLVLLLGMAALSYLVARQVVRPVREARLAAERLAAGHLDDRLRVRGTDDLASLAKSMNDMAAELEKQITQLEDLSRLQQRFVSDVSHELRTPLTTVRMAAEMLYENKNSFTPLVTRSTELLYDELDRFEALLVDLLEISRFDAGAAVLTVEETQICELVTAEVEAQRPFADRMGTRLTVHVEGDCEAEVDPRRIRRIVRNLITNAIEHSERLPIDVYIASSAEAVAIVVRDHGVGFKANQAQEVFSRFWRADPARSRTVGGTGLGLSIAMEDARLHGGWLNAWGRPHLGAQFRLTVPRRPGVIVRTSPLPIVPRDLDRAVIVGGTTMGALPPAPPSALDDALTGSSTADRTTSASRP